MSILKNLFISWHLKAIPGGVWALGFVSLLMDTSSELIHSLLPIFMVSTLGASMLMVGFVEGIAESIALIVKMFSGALSDYLGKRKLLTVLGYGLAAFTKPLFPLASSIGMVFTARFLDRVGKGIRGAPRDALMGDISPPEIRGACFGLRQALDTVGAFLGPILAILALLWWVDNLRLVLWIAVIPALLAMVVLIFFVKEPAIHRESASRARISWRDIRTVGRSYWELVVIGGVLTLARFSDAFLILKAMETGLSMMWVPMVMVVMNIVYSLMAYPAGRLSDRMDRKSVLLIGISFLIVADVILAYSQGMWLLGLGVIFWGLHMAFTQGLLAAMVTDTVPSELRGTGYGVFNVVSGVMMLLASIIAGLLWDTAGSTATFLVGGVFATIACIGILFFCKNKHEILV